MKSSRRCLRCPAGPLQPLSSHPSRDGNTPAPHSRRVTSILASTSLHKDSLSFHTITLKSMVFTLCRKTSVLFLQPHSSTQTSKFSWAKLPHIEGIYLRNVFIIKLCQQNCVTLSSEFEVNCFGQSLRVTHLLRKKAEEELRKSTYWQSYNILPGQIARQHSMLIFKN